MECFTNNKLLISFYLKEIFNGFCITLDYFMNFMKRLRKSFSLLFLSCRGVTDVDAIPGMCNIDKSGNSRDNLTVKCLGSHVNITEFNQGKACGEKSSTSGISP